MSNEKLREVKRATASKLPRHAQVAATRPAERCLQQPRVLSERFRLQAERRQTGNHDLALETITLPLEAARHKARAIIDDISQNEFRKVVENWRQLPDGRIEFTMRRVPVAD